MEDREARLAESYRLSSLLWRVTQRTMADFAAVVESFDLPVPVARAVLSLGEPTPMRELAGRLRCDPSWVTSLADDLERRGLAERTADPSDRRVKVLRLTGEGAAVRDRLAEAVARESTVMRRLDGGDRTALEPLLERLLDD